MRGIPTVAVGLALGASPLLPGCSGSRSGADGPGDEATVPTGRYVSVWNPELSVVLLPGGGLELAIAGVGKSVGRYRVEGEKVILSWEGQEHTVIRNGSCLEDPQARFDRSCIGGPAGAATNRPTRVIPAPEGTWSARSSDGDFRIDFLPGNRLRLSATPPGEEADIREVEYALAGDRIDATVGVDPMVLSYVNGAWETTSFGFPLRFVRQ